MGILLKTSVVVKVTYNDVYRAYGATKHALVRFQELELIVKAEHCADLYNEGKVIALDVPLLTNYGLLRPSTDLSSASRQLDEVT